MKTKLLLAAAMTTLGLSASASAITVDGNLDDWGVKSGGSWAPTTNAGIEYTHEDQTGTGAFYLTPGWGGQAYDAEALYATIVGNLLYIALVTGHNPDTLQNPGGNSFGNGDFAIDFGKNGSFEVGINFNHRTGTDTSGKKTYENLEQGGVYLTNSSNWNYGLWNVSGGYINTSSDKVPDPAHPTYIKNVAEANLLGMSNFARSSAVIGYGTNLTDTHFIYEMSLDVSLLEKAGWKHDAFNIHWTENCANDSIIVDPPAFVPEPGSLALLGMGLVGLAGMRRRIRA